MRATIYDVAKEAGVSIATVSHVLNGKGKISRERREEIRRIIERMNYQPSAIASALTSKKTFTLGLLIPDISNPFFAELARAVEDEGQRLGYSLFICSTDNQDRKVESYAALLRQKGVDGVIVGTGVDRLSSLAPLLERSIPVVFVSRECPDAPGIPSVVSDDYAGGAAAARHLLGLGHRRFAVIAESEAVSSSRERVRGFRDTLRDAGPLPPVKLERAVGIREGRQQALKLLRAPDRPTAIFCCNDLIAIGLLQGAKELGLRIPADCSVVGFDDTILASVTDPPLTTVAQPIERIGHSVIRQLVQSAEGRAFERERLVLEPSLTVRASTAPPSSLG
ncbi:LacI family DNA-binding transcriptional regulator [Cohnella thailandensis]|uniref:LacI family DNA-binding transcriptional regulator n=1 Tax=Cohnella thailandensis TaxID=557557 RepID=A0A841T892_9BACL|nr:LacI family DNA-binding transcriptional regulator [Cohnella thailandensis]MBB6638067.1 LacI family DNA-binding transcriptional regulator [Cohnella thailandensis]MBP1972007.1 LacI family transcriptional regulator [Cohnella thailandensis]